MEREMYSDLEWMLHIETSELAAFTDRIKKEYGTQSVSNPPSWVSTTAAVPTAVAQALLSLQSTRFDHRRLSCNRTYPQPLRNLLRRISTRLLQHPPTGASLPYPETIEL
jgi:hypothetical protein